MGLIKYLSYTLMAVMFAIAIIGYASNFAGDNRVYADIRKDSRISRAGLESDVQTFNLQVNSSSEVYTETRAEAGDESEESGGMFKTISSTYSGIKRILSMGGNILFGGEQGTGGLGIFLIGLGGILITMLILYGWKAWRGKNPD